MAFLCIHFDLFLCLMSTISLPCANSLTEPIKVLCLSVKIWESKISVGHFGVSGKRTSSFFWHFFFVVVSFSYQKWFYAQMSLSVFLINIHLKSRYWFVLDNTKTKASTKGNMLQKESLPNFLMKTQNLNQAILENDFFIRILETSAGSCLLILH